MGLRGRVSAYRSGWGEITRSLPDWMTSSGVVTMGSETVLSALVAPSTRIELIESRKDSNWKLAVESWAEGGVLRREPALVIGRLGTPPLLLRAAFARACLRGLENFEEHYEGSVNGPQVFERIHQLRTSGLI